jgi:hypothetical protein
MSQDKKYTLRGWDPESETFFEVEKTIDEIVENPYCLNAADIGVALLDKMREDRGLTALSPEALATDMYDTRNYERRKG